MGSLIIGVSPFPGVLLCGVLLCAELGVVGGESGVVVLQLQDVGDSGEVDAGVGEFADAVYAVQVVVAVAAGPPITAGGGQQPVLFIQAQGRGKNAGELCGHRDAVHPLAGMVRS